MTTTTPPSTGLAPGPSSTKRTPKAPRSRKAAARYVPLTIVLWVLAILYAFPLIWFLLSSFKPGSELFTYPLSIFPRDWTLVSYREAWSRFDFYRYFINTGLVAVITTVLTVFVSAITGYAFAKYQARWLKFFFVCILATTMLPTEVILPSTFAVIRNLGLYNSLAGIIIPSIITATGIFMFRQFFMTVPTEMLEAARIDGAGEIRTFFQIMLPLAKPIVVTLAIFSFQWRWNDYIWPLLVLNDQSKYTLQLALRTIVGAENIDWSLLLSASVISLIPMVIMFAVFQRYIMNADINSGLKD